jgi:superfamily II DNA helicase RecQ
MEVKDSIVKIIKSLVEIGEPVTRQLFIDYLMGKETREITDARMDEKETFGSGEAHDEDYWSTVIDAAFEHGLLKNKSAKKGDIVPTPAGKKFLRSPETIIIKDEGDMEEMPQDTGLDDIVQSALDVRMPAKKTTSLRTKQQMNLIHAIDCKIALDDVAENESLGFDEVLDELESLVHQGRRLDITYFTNEVLGADCIEELTDYFKAAKTDDLDQALKEYGDVYEAEEIRLARIVYRVQQMK